MMMHCQNEEAHMNRFAWHVIFLLCTSFGMGVIHAETDKVTTTMTDTGNLYLAGDDIRISEPALADLFVAGRRIIVEQSVGADGAIAGGMIDVKADINQDLRVAGGRINIGGNIGGDLVAAGGTVELEKSSRVGGSALIAGRDVLIGGRLAQGAKVYAARIALSGRIDGNTRLYAQNIVFSPGAKIDGELTYASANPLPPEQLAQVSGKVVREKTPEGWEPASRHSVTWFHPAFFLSMLACGSLLFFLFPSAVSGARQTIKSYPLRSLMIGLALLFMLPPVAVLFIVTLIGIPIGLGLLASYPLLLIMGYLAAAFFIGRETADVLNQPRDVTTGRQIAFLALALLILWPWPP
jgi:cytoskeletal protein CcmA (bactofilin family)